MQNFRDHNFRGRYRVIIKTKILKEEEVDLDKHNIQVMLEKMIKAVVNPDQDCE